MPTHGPVLEVSSMHQTIKGDPRDGCDELKPKWSYLSHFPPWYLKSGHFPIEIPIKNKQCLQNLSYGPILEINRSIFPIEIPIKNKECLQNLSYGPCLEIVLWAHFAVLRRSTDFFKNTSSGTP